MRVLWISLGLLSVGLGVVGVVLPLLPTVPFMLLAAFCFARSSERLHNWLLGHPRFGPAIEDWRARGAIAVRIKRISTLLVATVLAISLALGLPPAIIGIQAALLGCVLLFIWTRPG